MIKSRANPFRVLLRRRHLRRSLILRRAWQEVIDGPDPDSVSRVVSQLSTRRLPMPLWLFRIAGLPRDLDTGVETALRQTLLTQLYPHLMPGVMRLVTNRPAAIPIPQGWRAELMRRNLPIKEFASSLLLGQFAVTCFARGIRQVLRTLIAASTGRLPSAPNGPYHVAVQLPPSFLKNSPKNAETVFTNWLESTAPSGGIWLHSETTSRESSRHMVISPLPNFPDLQARAAFGLSSLRLAVSALIGLLIARPELAILLPETILLAHARNVGKDRLAQAYICENSRWFLRPLFTRWAAACADSKAVLAFYSTNTDECLRLRPTDREPTFIPGYESMDWDIYRVWDEHQADLLVAWGHDRSRAEILGPIPLTDSGEPLPPIPQPSLAVFDIAPFSPSRLAAMGLIPEYYRDVIAAQFLDDIRNQAQAAGILLVLKQKRERTRAGPPLYEAAMRRMLAAPQVLVLDPRISAARLAEACTGTLSMPFSSPSLIAAGKGRVAGFYDPTGRLIASERQTHSLPMIRGPEALGKWLRQLTSTAKAGLSGGNR